MKKNALILILFLLASAAAFSQVPTGKYAITGTVTDSVTQKPAEFVTLSLKNEVRQVIKTMLSKPDGSFTFTKLTEGRYTVTLVHVGYATKILTARVGGDVTQLSLGKIPISSQARQLNAVAITADKPLIKQEVDRISYDLQADPESKVNNVLEMMRKVPLLSVDAEDNIQLKGNSNYKILINGKPSSMVERNPKDILRSMPAASIQRIEVITTPPAKYDADGLAGIINIITNKKVDNGYNGSVNVNTRFPTGGPGTGESFTFKQGKIGLSAFGGGSLFNTPATSVESSRISSGAQSTILSQNSTRKSESKSAYLGAELSYELDSLNLFSVQFNLNGNRSEGQSGQASELFTTATMLQRYNLANLNKGRGNGFDAALNYQLGFKKNKNRMLTFSYRYYGFGNNQNSNLAISNQVNYNLPDYRQLNESSADEQTFQIDYVQPLKKLSIEAGVKGIMRNNKSDFKYLTFQSLSGEFIQDPLRTNTFNNRQNVYGAYNTYQYNLKNWGFKAGIRVENTVVDAEFVTNASQVKQNYFNVVPSVSVNRKFKNMSSLNLGFSQRIQRPGINQLNPFVDRSNPNFESSGNPELRPTTGSILQVSYSYFKKVTLNYNLSYNWIKGVIFPVSVLDPVSNITRTRYENTGKAKVIGNNFNVNYPFSSTWNLSMNANVNYGWAQGLSNGEPIKNQGLMYSANMSTNKRFDKGWRLSAGLNFNGGNLTIQERSNAFISSSFTATKELVKDKLSFSASTANPFSKYRTNHTHTFGPNYDQNNYSQQYFRNVNFSMNYRFGKLKESIKKNKRGISNDDVSN